jgi:hypothetical protein
MAGATGLDAGVPVMIGQGDGVRGQGPAQDQPVTPGERGVGVGVAVAEVSVAVRT